MRLFLRSGFIILFVLGSLSALYAQPTDQLALANEYFRKGEYDKALTVYEQLADNNTLLFVIYPNYLHTLLAVNNYKDAEKLVKKAIKRSNNNPNYLVDLGIVQLRSGNKEAAAKHFDRLIQQTEPQLLPALAGSFQANDLPDYAEKTFLHGRKLLKDELAYSQNLIALYTQTHDIPKLIHESLTFAQQGQGALQYAQNLLQNALKEEKDFAQLETALLQRVQKQPEQVAFPELLTWLYVQRKDFFNALLQAKSIDKRLKTGGQRVIEIGNISLKNKDYESAIEAFTYVITNYSQGPFYLQARQRLINSREEQVKNTFPLNKENIRQLITQYEQYLTELGHNSETIEVMKNMAVLYANYLDEKEKAIGILNEIIATPRANANLVAESKLHLGDIYLLKNEPWEATLLYSQVEKSHKETPIGHEAKLRNARLNYFKGEFELAQEHLDILKMATSREIANDAMKLSILITDNTGLDSTTFAMNDFARSELLLFQHKYLGALQLLDSMLLRYPGHSLSDDVYLQKATIYRQLGDAERAATALQQIIDHHSQDILADDALFMLAQLTEEQLQNKAKALELYTLLLTKHPGSLFVVEARKRLRKLRGDAVN